MRMGLGLNLRRRGGRGPEIWPQPGFDSAAGLTLDPAWSIAGGVATANGTTGFMSVLGALTIGKTYEATVEIKSRTSGSIYQPYDGSGGNVIVTSLVQVHTRTFVAATVNLRIYSNSFTGTIDNVSVREVLP